MDFELVRPLANLISQTYRHYLSIGHTPDEAMQLARFTVDVTARVQDAVAAGIAAHEARKAKATSAAPPAEEPAS